MVIVYFFDLWICCFIGVCKCQIDLKSGVFLWLCYSLKVLFFEDVFVLVVVKVVVFDWYVDFWVICDVVMDEVMVFVWCICY